MSEFVNTRDQIALGLPQGDGAEDFFPPPASFDPGPIPSLKLDAQPGVCPGCDVPFTTGRLRDRQAKGFDRCIDCMIAEGREAWLHEDDQIDLAEKRLTRGET